jgi:hypothetical protein
MSTPLLVIGTAPAGPEGQVIQIIDKNQLESYFAPPRYLSVSWASYTTQLMLPSEAWGSDIHFFQWVSGKLKEITVYNSAVSGSVVTMDPPGASGSAVVRYYPIPDENDIAPAVRSILAEGGNFPKVYRSPGVKATINLGAMTLSSDEGGTGLNNQTLTVSSSGGIVGISFTDIRDSSQRNYNYSANSVGALTDLINKASSQDKIPFSAVAAIPQATSLPSGIKTFLGGGAGTLDFDDLAQSIDLEGVETVLIAGGVSVQNINKFLAAWETTTPTLLFTGTPIASASMNQDSLVALCASEASQIKDPRVFRVPGWYTAPGPLFDQASNNSLASPFAGVWNKSFASPTHQGTSINNITPFWTKTQLQSLQGNNCPYTRFISTNIGAWSSNSTDGTDPVAAKIRQEIHRRLYNILAPYIGHADTPDDLEAQCKEAIDSLPGTRERSLTLTRDKEKIQVDISLIRYGEVKAINFTLVSYR